VSSAGGGRVRLSVIVVNYRARELLLECLDHVERALALIDGETELIVIENAAHDDLPDVVRRRFPSAVVVEERENTGFAPAVARGVGMARGEWIALVNNDANVEPDAFRALLETGESGPSIGAVAAQVRFAGRPDVLNSTGIEVNQLGVAWERLAGEPVRKAEAAPRDVFGATACVALYRRAMLDAIGGFDASFFAYLEDVDVAWRARMAGWEARYQPRAIAYHHGSTTSREGSAFKYALVGRNRIRLLAKNATAGQLARYGVAMVAYDLAYVAVVALSDRTLAPLRGRSRGLREWRRYRRAGAAGRRATALAGLGSAFRALRMRRAYRFSVRQPR
jgi:GT2 family glycosyltransferase